MNYFDDATLLKIIDLHLSKAGANKAYSSNSFVVTDLLQENEQSFSSKNEINSMFEEDETAKKSLWISLLPKMRSLKLPKTNSKNIKEYLQTRYQQKRNL